MARGRHSAYFGRTKGHSILPQRSYGLLGSSSLPSRHYNLDEDYPPITYRAPINFHHGADYYAANAMANHATHLSTDTVYDNIDLAEKSRGKDKRLMSQVNAALAYATPSTPARARASRRANRQQDKSYYASPLPVYSPTYNVPPQEDLDYQPHYQAAVNRDRYDRFHLRPSATANRVYASGSLASKATPRPSSGKTIRQVEGYSKPKNLLSWQYRIDSYSDPSDVFYTPASVYKMKDRVRDVQERLDLHRQMLDRYLQVDLGPDDDVSSRIARKHRDVESRQHE